MNVACIVGNLTRDPDVRYGGKNNETCVARWTVAVSRAYKKEGQQDSDFISCITTGKAAEFVEKYFHKGMKMGVVGNIQTGSYEKDGHKVFTTDLYAEKVEFVESKGQKEEKKEEPKNEVNQGFMSILDGADDEGLPFN